MRNKLHLTEELLGLLPNEEKIPIEQAMVTWWFNLREQGGLRLTNTGYSTLKKSLKLETYRFDLNQPRAHQNKKLILGLDRKLEWPYYLSKQKLEFFSSKEAMMAQLYQDIEAFLNYRR
jgi:hypothetical protein